MNREPKRVVVWYSCGVTSAVAAKLTVEKYRDKLPVAIVYCDTGAEHPDNERFMLDCERWYGQDIRVLKNERYSDIWDVFEKTRYLAGVQGARCTYELKKRMRQEFEDLEHDIQVFGFDAGEKKRAEIFKQNNPEVMLSTPLLDKNLTKPDCLAILKEVGIELPTMYKLGYRNNNCIGCVKGQMGYWNKIRVDFPEVFERMAKMERKINVALCKSYAGDGKRKRVFLDELDPTAGRYSEEPPAACGLLCGEILEEISDEECMT